MWSAVSVHAAVVAWEKLRDLQFSPFQLLAADQGTEDGQAKQGFRINRVDDHSW